MFGRYLYAVGRNEDAARYSGINSQMIISGTYVIEMLLVGMGGILIAFYTNSISPANHGSSYELYAIAAAVLGGCSLRGGEGVLGLRRGFIQASAQNLLMTLWPINDKTTVDIMLDFYQRALATADPPRALAEVQRDWLVKLRKERGLLRAAELVSWALHHNHTGSTMRRFLMGVSQVDGHPSTAHTTTSVLRLTPGSRDHPGI
jgi:hypothetical protein